jgi:hypothetical protein
MPVYPSPASQVAILSPAELISSGDVTVPAPVIDGNRATNRPGGTDKNSVFFWSCTDWEQNNDGIVMLVNPSQVRWSIPLRVTRVNVFGGTILHRWRNLTGSSVDLPVLSFTMNTGLLYPLDFFATQGYAENSNLVGGSPYMTTQKGSPVNTSSRAKMAKIEAFYKFVKLMHIGAFVQDGEHAGEPNIVSLQYRTLLFPQVILYLQFLDPLQFTEDAMKPYNVEYTISAVLLRSFPSLDNTDELLPALGDVMIGG